MKKTVFCVGKSHSGSYKGGIITIVEQYLENENIFNKNQYCTELLNPYNGLKISSKIKKRGIKILFDIFEQRKYAVQGIKISNADVFHMHSSRQWTLLKDMFIARGIRKVFSGKMVLSIHFAEMNKILYSNKLLAKYQLNTIKKCFDKIIFLSKETQKEFIAAGVPQSKTEVLYTFHNFNYDDSAAKKNDGPVDLLFVGSIDRRKGIIDLLNVLKNIERDKFRLHICGQLCDDSIKEEYNDLLNELGENAVFHGYVSGKEKEEIFRNADALILPSYGEGMPIVIMEALSAGCAIISTTVGAIPEIIGEENGVLINPGDTEALKNAILSLIQDREKLNSFKQKNYEYGKKFNLESNIRDLCRIYEE